MDGQHTYRQTDRDTGPFNSCLKDIIRDLFLYTLFVKKL